MVSWSRWALKDRGICMGRRKDISHLFLQESSTYEVAWSKALEEHFYGMFSRLSQPASIHTHTHTKPTCPHGISLHTWKWSHPKSNNRNIINRPLLLILAYVQSCPTLCNPMDCSPPGSSSPWYFPGRNTEVGCHFFLQGIFLTQGSNSHLLSPTLAGRFFTTDLPGKLHQGLGVSQLLTISSVAMPLSLWDPNSPTRDWTWAMAVKAQIHNQLLIGELQPLLLFNPFLLIPIPGPT